jgi:hypothetical protein
LLSLVVDIEGTKNLRNPQEIFRKPKLFVIFSNLIRLYKIKRSKYKTKINKKNKKEIYFSILLTATSYISGSFSIPIKFLFIFLQATPVEPLPIVGSKTTSPSLE